MSFGATFLHNSDLFPARRSGEAWGERRLVLALPGGPYRFDGLNDVQEAIVLEKFGGFRVEASEAAVESRIFRAPESDFRDFDRRGWHYSLDFDYGPDAVRIAGLRLVARLDWRPALAGALWTPDGGGDHFAGIFENFCRVLVAYRLLEQGGAVVHSAGVVRRVQSAEDALLFVGHSGAGKTTVSRMSLDRGATVLSDDLNALLPALADGPILEALPFTGDLGGQVSAGARFPLRALMRLEKSPAESLAPLSRAEAVATLLACCPFVNVDPHRRGDLLANLAGLAAGLPSYALRFSLSGAMWGILPGNA